MLKSISTKRAPFTDDEPSYGTAVRGQSIASSSIEDSNSAFSPPELEEIFKILILSPRQKEIVTLILLGLRDRQIAARMNVGIQTIRVHMKRLFAKYKINSRTQLIMVIFRAFRMKYQEWVVGDNTYLLAGRTCHTERKVGELLDEIWPTFATILPSIEGHLGKRQPASNRDCLHALLYVTAFGISWQQLPKWLPGYFTVLRRRKKWMEQENFRAAWFQVLQACRQLRIVNRDMNKSGRFPIRDPAPVNNSLEVAVSSE